MDEQIKTKVCAHCGVEQKVTEFSKNSTSKDGLQSWCKTCTNKYNKWYERVEKRIRDRIKEQYEQKYAKFEQYRWLIEKYERLADCDKFGPDDDITVLKQDCMESFENCCGNCKFLGEYTDDGGDERPYCKYHSSSCISEDGYCSWHKPKTNLLPCPFCGENAVLECHERQDGIIVYNVSCTTPGCICSTAIVNDYVYEEDAINSWNSRA